MSFTLSIKEVFRLLRCLLRLKCWTGIYVGHTAFSRHHTNPFAHLNLRLPFNYACCNCTHWHMCRLPTWHPLLNSALCLAGLDFGLGSVAHCRGKLTHTGICLDCRRPTCAASVNPLSGALLYPCTIPPVFPVVIQTFEPFEVKLFTIVWLSLELQRPSCIRSAVSKPRSFPLDGEEKW